MDYKLVTVFALQGDNAHCNRALHHRLPMCKGRWNYSSIRGEWPETHVHSLNKCMPPSAKCAKWTSFQSNAELFFSSSSENKRLTKNEFDCIDNSHQLHWDHRNIGDGPLGQQDGAFPPATGASAVAGRQSFRGAHRPGHYLQSIHLTLLASTVTAWGCYSTHPSLPSLTPLNLLILCLPHCFLWQQIPCCKTFLLSFYYPFLMDWSFVSMCPHSSIVGFFKPQSNSFSLQTSIYHI